VHQRAAFATDTTEYPEVSKKGNGTEVKAPELANQYRVTRKRGKKKRTIHAPIG